MLGQEVRWVHTGGGSLVSVCKLGSAGEAQAVGWRSAEGDVLIRYQHFIFGVLR